MFDALGFIAAASGFLRASLLGVGVLFAVVAAGDWMVRTRRLNPFSAIARFMRSRVDPRLAGVERQVMRMGGNPTATPWWALVIYVMLAALLLAGIDMVLGAIAQGIALSQMGAPGILFLIVRWTFAFLQIALLVRVLSSWFPRIAHTRWLGWSYGATEWMLRPLRRVLPAMGMIDISPIVAYFALQILEWAIGSILTSALG